MNINKVTTGQKVVIGVGIIAGALLLLFFWKRGVAPTPPAPGTASLKVGVIDAETKILVSNVEVSVDGRIVGYTNGMSDIVYPGLIIQELALGYHEISLHHPLYMTATFSVHLVEGWNQETFELVKYEYPPI